MTNNTINDISYSVKNTPSNKIWDNDQKAFF